MVETRHQEVYSATPARTFLCCAQYILFFAGLLAVTYVGFVFVETQIYQADQSQQLERAPKLDLRAPPTGSAVGKVKIPRIGLEAVVAQGDTEKILRVAVGHIPGTALPGQPGNTVLAGHRDTFFRSLRNIRVGDRVVIENPMVPTTMKSNRFRLLLLVIHLCCEIPEIRN